LQIKLAKAGIPYLLELRDLIPATSLRAFLQLSSKHAKRIYALCRRYQAKKLFKLAFANNSPDVA